MNLYKKLNISELDRCVFCGKPGSYMGVCRKCKEKHKPL